MAIPSHPTIRPSASRICLPGTNISRRAGFSSIAARAVMADTTRRVSSFSTGRSITCPNVVRNTGISPYGVTSVRTSSDVSDTRAMPELLISFPPTTSVWGVKFKICFMNITTCTAWIYIFPYMFFLKKNIVSRQADSAAVFFLKTLLDIFLILYYILLDTVCLLPHRIYFL